MSLSNTEYTTLPTWHDPLLKSGWKRTIPEGGMILANSHHEHSTPYILQRPMKHLPQGPSASSLISSVLASPSMCAHPLIGFPGGAVVTNLPANAGDASSMPGSGRSPGEGKGNPRLGNPMDRGAWRATVHGITKSHTLLSDSTTTTTY